jgi:hypothetical protein
VVAERLVKRVLDDLFPGASVILVPAAGGLIVGLVRSDFSPRPGRDRELEVLRRVAEENGRIANVADRASIFRIAFYADSQAVFAEDATLRARRDGFEGHVRVSYRTSLDVDVKAHELEAEAMSIDPSNLTCRVRQANEGRRVIGRFEQFDLLGMTLEVDHVEDQRDGVWVVHVGAVT